MVGIGRWSKVLAGEIEKVDNAVIYSCFSRNVENKEAFARQYKCESKNSFEDLINDPKLDVVVLVTANHVHREQTIAAARAGKHVFVDKPIANSLEDSFVMVRECKKHKVILAIGHNSRRDWEVQKIKSLLAKKIIGKISMVEANFSHSGGLRVKEGDWRYYKETCPSGPLIQLGIHHIDSLQYLFGPIEQVSALFSRLYTPGEIDDTTATIFTFKSGIVGYNGSGYTINPIVKGIRIYGTEGSIIINDDLHEGGLRVTCMSSKTQKMEKKTYGRPETETIFISLKYQIEDLANAIQKKEIFMVTPEESIRALAVVEAADISQRTGKVVNVDSLISKYDKNIT